jgi:hypothetical protein
MTLLAQAAEVGTIEGLPRIDRYFPECWCATVEAVAKFRFGIRDFGKIYGRHTFYYERKPGPIVYRSNNVELDLWIHREHLQPTELESSMEAIYGIRTTIKTFDRFSAYWEYCAESIRNRVPVVTDFDLRFIKARREYGKVTNPHVIAVFGYQARERVILAAEQMIGTISVDFEDFERCFEQKIAARGNVTLWELSRAPHAERELGRDEVAARIQANLKNLGSSSDTLGLRALARFREELAEYLQSEAFKGKPFALPGVWVFSHERHIQKKWLRAIQHLCSSQQAPEFFDEFEAVLSKLFTRWLNADYLIEKCLASGNGKALKSLPNYLRELLDDETRVVEKWVQLQAIVACG